MSNSDPEDWLEIRKEKAIAFGRLIGSDFMVRAGSTAMRNGSPSVKRDREERDLLIQEGILAPDDDPDLLVFMKDHLFSSRSLAAGVVIDGNSNGSHWKKMSDVQLVGPASLDLSREQIEAAIDRYEALLENDPQDDLKRFGDPRDYWVRSSRARQAGPFPTKPIVALAAGLQQLNGGWSTRDSAASRLHNAGFVIVGNDGDPASVPEDRPFLIKGADRVRACALNYYIAPARERGQRLVSIRAGTLHDEIGLSQNWANVCQALAGQKFQELARVEAPIQDGPEASTSTTFTYQLESQVNDSTRTADAPTNLILYGPPGTGKTYATALEAVNLCIGREEAKPLAADRHALMARYRQLVTSKQIEFVTFHQSFSYEDFVEGLRPTTDTTPVLKSDADSPTAGGFRLEAHPGVFRRIAENAQRPQQVEGQTFDPSGRKIFKMSLGYYKDPDLDYLFDECIDEGKVLLGWSLELDWSDPKYEDENELLAAVRQHPDHHDAKNNTPYKTFPHRLRNLVRNGDVILVSRGNSNLRAIAIVTGDYFFEGERDDTMNHGRRVQWLWHSDGPATDIPVSDFYPRGFNMKSLYEMNASEIDWQALGRYVVTDTKKAHVVPHVLIIDEINRANISKVFGELITLLEPDKRLGGDNEIKVRLPYSGASFGVPSNLHIIGTMNTADRSIALLDTALRRRFTFRELMPDPSVLPEDVEGIDLRKLLILLNDRIEFLFDREHQIGHAYLIGCRTRADVDSVMRYNIIPLLAEYFYEDWSKIASVLGERPSDGESVFEGRFLRGKRLISSGFEGSGEDASSRIRWSVKEVFDFSEFLRS